MQRTMDTNCQMLKDAHIAWLALKTKGGDVKEYKQMVADWLGRIRDFRQQAKRARAVLKTESTEKDPKPVRPKKKNTKKGKKAKKHSSSDSESSH